MFALRPFLLAVSLVFVPLASSAGIDDIAALRQGTMKKLVFHPEPKAVSQVEFQDADGNTLTLADYKGKYILVNFWATWCAPCRKEMPSLDRLQARLGGDNFAVVTIATGKNPMPAINRFFQDQSIDNLPVLLDPSQALANDMSVLGLPITALIDPNGREIARLRGDADWDDDSAIAIITALTTGR